MTPAGRLKVFTDGACKGNPGPGGWALIPRRILEDGTTLRGRPRSGGEPITTNNRMELQAAIEALKAFPEEPIEIVTDSRYVVDGATAWLPAWKANGWRTSAKKAVANADLWRELDALAVGREVVWTWVQGHAGHAENEEADRLARMGLHINPRSRNPALR